MKNMVRMFLVSAVLLTGCATTVIDDEDRTLPDEAAELPAEEEVDNGLTEEELSTDEVEEEQMPDEEDDNNEMMEEEPSGEAMEGPVQLEADVSKSFIAFTGAKGDLVSHQGKFNNFSVTVTQPVETAPNAVNASIDIGSMETDSGGLTDHLLAADFFDAASFPTATFVSTSVESTGGDNYVITGTLTIKSVAKTVTLNANLTDTYMTATGTLDRTDFGVGGPPEGVKAIDAAVPIELKLVF